MILDLIRKLLERMPSILYEGKITRMGTRARGVEQCISLI
jgi:hypothetical protein